MNDKRPLIGITMGDPVGIGPEIIVRALSRHEIYHFCKPLVIGDKKMIKKMVTKLGTDVRGCDISLEDIHIEGKIIGMKPGDSITSLTLKTTEDEKTILFPRNLYAAVSILYGQDVRYSRELKNDKFTNPPNEAYVDYLLAFQLEVMNGPYKGITYEGEGVYTHIEVGGWDD